MRIRKLAPAAALLLASMSASAGEAMIRATLPRLLAGHPKLDQVERSPIAGLWTVRIGSTVLFTDPTGTMLIEGNQLVNLKTRRNHTQELLARALTVPFDKLPLQDAIVTHKNGDGSRKVAVFADPNCTFCKRYEHSIKALSNVTVYTFIIPVLGQKSEEIARAVECSSDPASAWTDWMLRAVRPAEPEAACQASATMRNRSFAAAHHITSTPTTFFPSGARVAGEMGYDALRTEIEKPSKQR